MGKKKIKRKNNFDKIWPFLIEPISTAIIGLIAFLKPFNQPDIAIIIWAIGAIDSISSIVSRKQLISDAKEVLDEKMRDVQSASKILSLYSEIHDPDLIQLKKESLNKCLSELENLSNGYLPDIRNTTFYMWFINQFNNAEISISSVSSMPEKFWVEFEAERKSLQANYEAAERGCESKRIFILKNMDSLTEGESRKVFFEHYEHSVQSLITYEEQINDHDLWEIVKNGFVIIDDRVLLLDIGEPPNTTGRMSKIVAEIGNYRKAFNQLEITSIPAMTFLKSFLNRKINEYEKEYKSITELKKNRINEKQSFQIINNWESMLTDLDRINKIEEK